jgi:methyltransferase-like protein
MVNPISISISPFLVIDANTNQSKYGVQKCN